MSDNSILSRIVSAVDPPAAAVEIVGSEADRTALAAAFDIVAVKALAATVTLSPIPGGVEVEGHIVADIVQTCVVTLVPVDEHIDENFSVRYVRDAERLRPPGVEVVVDPDAPDPPELLEGPSLDVGALVEEYFALAINPYPRAPGAALPAELADDGSAKQESPFAILAALAKTPDPKR